VDERLSHVSRDAELASSRMVFHDVRNLQPMVLPQILQHFDLTFALHNVQAEYRLLQWIQVSRPIHDDDNGPDSKPTSMNAQPCRNGTLCVAQEARKGVSSWLESE
jgi:hypothetical protein